ncbi:MAG: hypothetical protein LUE27_10335 [Clostridia bacterium]|nr:hypothetical protein [Clostridia bacterium]
MSADKAFNSSNLNPSLRPSIFNLSIRPSKDIRTNYSQISALSKENPVAITVNGKEDTYVLCHDDFYYLIGQVLELSARLSLYDKLAQAEDDIRLGRVTPIDQAFKEVYDFIDKVEI